MIIQLAITASLIHFWIVARSYRSEIMDERRGILPTQQTPVQTREDHHFKMKFIVKCCKFVKSCLQPKFWFGGINNILPQTKLSYLREFL